jgi:uncharacterized protein YegL
VTPAGAQITIQHRLGQDPLPAAGGPQMAYTLLDVLVGAAGGLALPLNLCLVLDQSLSMHGEKIERVREAARYVVSQLGSRDSLSVVAFNDRANVVMSARLGPSKNETGTAVENIVPRGGTELAAGLKAGLDELRRGAALTGKAISSLLVLTDGRTYGDESRCLELAEQARRADVQITPLGVGEEWNEDLLEAIAYRCGSHSVYIDRAAAIVEAFRQHLDDLRGIIGRDGQLLIETAADTRLAGIHRVAPLIGRVEVLPSPNVSEQRFALGNLRSGETQRLLLELVVPAAADGLLELAGCGVEWQAVDSHSTGRVDHPIRAAVDRHARPTMLLDGEVKSAVERVMAYKLQKRAWQDIQEGNVAQATNKLRMVATRLLEVGEEDLARTVQAEIEHLEQHGAASDIGTKQIKYGTRGLGRTQAMRTPGV